MQIPGKISGEARSHRFLSRLLNDRRGNTLAIAAASLVPIAAIIGSGLDMARGYMAEAKLQNACDAAALAARRYMDDGTFTNAAESEGERFFNFNFPATTMNAQNIEVEISQSEADNSTVEVEASAEIPTTLMSMFGKTMMPISVSCDADMDFGHNDVMLVLDVTGSMNQSPSTGGSAKIALLRTAANSLYAALAGADGSRTRFGIMPYATTVNVGADLRNMDIRRTPYFWTASYSGGSLNVYQHQVNINDTQWNAGNSGASIQQFRMSGEACVEERPTYGQATHPIVVSRTVSREDIDVIAGNTTQTALQWGFYDPDQYDDFGIGSTCPEPASKLQEYASQSAFTSAISSATASVGGNTYHDVGMIWGLRYISSTGMFQSDNPTVYNGGTVNRHIIFLTDGEIATNERVYTAYGVNKASSYTLDNRVQYSSGSRNQAHIDRFLSACSQARSMGITVWVIALDVTKSSDIRPCASGDAYFYESDGTDLDDVFATIGQGIGRLRLTE